MNGPARVHATVRPAGSLDVLSRREVERFCDAAGEEVYALFRQCALAVLNSGSPVDDAKRVLEQYRDFGIRVIPEERGIKLELDNAPPEAFVDGRMIQGIREHLFAVLRDTVYLFHEVRNNPLLDLGTSQGITDAVFHILRNARVFRPDRHPDLVVCWGGHAIPRQEYEYTKEVGYELGLRGLHVCTGCGPGAMKGPMKGATIGHAKQRIPFGRYLGITEPGIIAAEAPNPIVSQLVIMPDIEKRLEAFVRTGHAIVVFPGGVGTMEEILYLLGILLHPANAELPFPVIFTGPSSSQDYFARIHRFIGATLGYEAQQRYRILVGDPAGVARAVRQGIQEVERHRRARHDAWYFNWLLHVEHSFQTPFEPTHENMAGLRLHADMDRHELAVNLRRAFSGIVAGNVKAEGVRAIEQRGPFEIRGDRDILEPLDALLRSFVAEGRMKLAAEEYVPCYRLVS